MENVVVVDVGHLAVRRRVDLAKQDARHSGEIAAAGRVLGEDDRPASDERVEDGHLEEPVGEIMCKGPCYCCECTARIAIGPNMG